jgi:small multidrug resistance family-3 protein
MQYLISLIFLAAAVLEVGGDALVRAGLVGRQPLLILVGFLTLGFYGIMVNMIKWDFSRLLGVYVAVFALISVLCGKFIFKENISTSTWLGLTVIIAGGIIIQAGQK